MCVIGSRAVKCSGGRDYLKNETKMIETESIQISTR